MYSYFSKRPLSGLFVRMMSACISQTTPSTRTVRTLSMTRTKAANGTQVQPVVSARILDESALSCFGSQEAVHPKQAPGVTGLQH